MLKFLRPVSLIVPQFVAAITTMSSAPSSGLIVQPQAVLDFWFADTAGLKARKEWFFKDPAFDEEIREKFLPTLEAAARGELKSWESEKHSSLALVITLDQFPRNLFRGSARSFAMDPEALRVSKAILDKKGWYDSFAMYEKSFILLPFEHDENLESQRKAVELAEGLGDGAEELVKYAKLHMEIIEKFGRFPHRNEMLGRKPTEEEEKFLAEGGARF
jgi:uncharacterized protein (DUF924 family)